MATILLLVTRTWLAPLAAAIIGAFLAPLAWMILKVPDTSTAEVVVINRSADYLVRHGTPYLPASLITDWQHYNPYLPLMELFGLPREAGLPGLLGDPRIWTSLVTVAALTAAFALISPHQVRGCADCRRRLGVLTAIAVASPLVAFPLTVGVTDPPIIALTCLTLALAAAASQFVSAGLVLAVACAMKSTAWAVVPVLAVMAWVRESPRVGGQVHRLRHRGRASCWRWRPPRTRSPPRTPSSRTSSTTRWAPRRTRRSRPARCPGTSSPSSATPGT